MASRARARGDLTGTATPETIVASERRTNFFTRDGCAARAGINADDRTALPAPPRLFSHSRDAPAHFFRARGWGITAARAEAAAASPRSRCPSVHLSSPRAGAAFSCSSRDGRSCTTSPRLSPWTRTPRCFPSLARWRTRRRSRPTSAPASSAPPRSTRRDASRTPRRPSQRSRGRPAIGTISTSTWCRTARRLVQLNFLNSDIANAYTT